MSAPRDDRAKMEHIVGECFVKAANIILSSRINQTSRTLPKPTTSKRSWVRALRPVEVLYAISRVKIVEKLALVLRHAVGESQEHSKIGYLPEHPFLLRNLLHSRAMASIQHIMLWAKLNDWYLPCSSTWKWMRLRVLKKRFKSGSAQAAPLLS